MTTSHARGIKPEALSDNSVADYLQTYPDFFERNSQLLTKLRLPHVRDGASTVSLVERQVEVLRERNQALAAVPFLVFAAPFIIVRNTVRGRRIEGRNFGFAALAAVVAGFWSLMSGTVVVMALQAIGHLVA